MLGLSQYALLFLITQWVTEVCLCNCTAPTRYIKKEEEEKKEPFQPSCPLFLPLSLSHTHISVAFYQKITAPPSAMYKKRMAVNRTDTIIFATRFGSYLHY